MKSYCKRCEKETERKLNPPFKDGSARGTNCLPCFETYQCYQAMHNRCENEKHPYYIRYGGSGIEVCQQWGGDFGFDNFIKDMGYRPSKKHSIDRIDNNGHYKPDNCRWSTDKEQQRNRKCNIIVEVEGITRVAAEWAELAGLERHVVSRRLRAGWPPFLAVKSARDLVIFLEDEIGKEGLYGTATKLSLKPKAVALALARAKLSLGMV